MVIALELMSGGMLTGLCEGEGKIRDEAHIAYVLACALRALAFMHRQHHVHRDIKSDNILVRVLRGGVAFQSAPLVLGPMLLIVWCLDASVPRRWTWTAR